MITNNNKCIRARGHATSAIILYDYREIKKAFIGMLLRTVLGSVLPTLKGITIFVYNANSI
jgi:hypothetical protein